MKRMTRLGAAFLLATIPTAAQAECRIIQSGKMSVYADSFVGNKMPGGGRFSQGGMTAAHKTLPFGSVVRVVDLDTNRTLNNVTITDRGPFVKGRILDVTQHIWHQLGHKGKPGLAHIQLAICN